MSENIQLHVGSIDEMGQRFIDAWHRLEHGETVQETHLTLFSLEALLSTLSPRRLALLKHVCRYPAKALAELGKSLGRDYKLPVIAPVIGASASTSSGACAFGLKAAMLMTSKWWITAE